jgi:hypothetical protein
MNMRLPEFINSPEFQHLVPSGRDQAAVPLLLTQQLDGVIELQRNGGTTFTITFTELQNQKRV